MAISNGNFKSLYEAFANVSFEIGSKFYAKPTHLVDPHNFFLIPIPFLEHLPNLTKLGEKLQIEELKVNAVVIYTSEKADLNKYLKIQLDNNIRGMIQKINEDKTCQIFALDYGFVEDNVSVDRINHPLHKEAIDMPSLTQHCELVLCSPKGSNFSNNAINAFIFYIGNEKLSVVIKDKIAEKFKVVVYNSNPDDVATLLALTHYTYLSSNICQELNAMTVSLPRTIEHVDLSIGETLTVRVQSGSSLESFYVTPVSSYKEYLKIRADFSNYCRFSQEINSKEFSVGTMVGVQDYNFVYERGVIMDVNTDVAKVKLIDWGTELHVPIERVKKVKTEIFLEIPPFALYCKAVNEFKPWNNGLPKFLYKGYSFSITVKEIGNGFDVPHTVSLSPVKLV